jgi:hypothetical protein
MSSFISGVPLTSVPPPGVVPPGYERKFLYVQLGMFSPLKPIISQYEIKKNIRRFKMKIPK